MKSEDMKVKIIVFWGYKKHISMKEDRIITGIELTTGEEIDGKYMKHWKKKQKSRSRRKNSNRRLSIFRKRKFRSL